MLFDKDIMIKRHMDIYADLSESPLFVYQSRKHKQWGLIIIYTCNMWSVQNFQGYFAKIKKKVAANKIHLSHLNAFMIKNEMTYSKMKCSKILHNMYISRWEVCVSATQEIAGSGLNTGVTTYVITLIS